VVVYKVERLSRSLLDFGRILGVFEEYGASFVSVTQQFNTSCTSGPADSQYLLSFAHYAERAIMQSDSAEVTVWLAFPSLGYSA
jgi:DNA invertase Pin-like site-specific DNA recombinase